MSTKHRALDDVSQATAVIVVWPSVAGAVRAQQTTGVPGSPDATTTIDGRYIPPPQRFEKWSMPRVD
jgi:hypothetical protein